MSDTKNSGLTRRGFSGLAAGCIAAATLVSPAKAMQSRTPKPAVDLVLFDGRFSDAGRFADAAQAAGAVALPTHGDLGALWFGGLRDDLGSMVKRVAGMGRHSDFWIMQQLAATKGMTLKFYAEHDFRGRTMLTHRLPEQAAGLQHAMTAGDQHWAERVAQHVVASSADFAPRPLADVASATSAGPDHPGLLVTWVFS